MGYSSSEREYWSEQPSPDQAAGDQRGPTSRESWYDWHGGWQPWGRVKDESAAQGSPISAIAHRDSINLFVVGTDGSIRTTYWKPDAGWHAWGNVRSRHGSAVQGSPITAISPGPDDLNLFVVGTDGSILTTYWKPDAGWHSWGMGRELPSRGAGAARPAPIPPSSARWKLTRD